jgi:hypothetical protein
MKYPDHDVLQKISLGKDCYNGMNLNIGCVILLNSGITQTRWVLIDGLQHLPDVPRIAGRFTYSGASYIKYSMYVSTNKPQSYLLSCCGRLAIFTAGMIWKVKSDTASVT